MGIRVLSLFDGISCGRIALERAGIEVEKYIASEIKKFAIKCTLEHYPDTLEVGDVTKLHYENGALWKNCEKSDSGWILGEKVFEGTIDLLIGGSPCQDFSTAGYFYKGEEEYGLKGQKSRLFYEYLRLLEETTPKYFLLENVKMRKDSEERLNEFLGVDGIHINSSLVSFQNRERLYWTNIPDVGIPGDKKISFQDYKDTDKAYCSQFKVKRTPSRERMWNGGIYEKLGNCNNITNAEKIGCLTRKQDRCPNSGLIEFEDFCRFLTRREIEMAQTLPVGYTDCLSYIQMQDVCGDGWTVDVIAHIFKNLKEMF